MPNKPFNLLLLSLSVMTAACSTVTPKPLVIPPVSNLPSQHFYDGEKPARELSAGSGIVHYDNEPEPFVGPLSPTFSLSGQNPDLLVRIGSNDQQQYTGPATGYLDHWLASKAAMMEEMQNPAKVDMTVHFGFNKTGILDPERLNAVLYSEKLHPNTQILVNGYTDNIGGKGRHNQILSQQRALEVKRVLVEHGVPDELVETEGLGPKNPVGNNKTSEGRAMNRRAESNIHPVGTGEQAEDTQTREEAVSEEELAKEAP